MRNYYYSMDGECIYKEQFRNLTNSVHSFSFSADPNVMFLLFILLFFVCFLQNRYGIKIDFLNYKFTFNNKVI